MGDCVFLLVSSSARSVGEKKRAVYPFFEVSYLKLKLFDATFFLICQGFHRGSFCILSLYLIVAQFRGVRYLR